jgi:predicted transcriptional regulator
LTTAVVTATVTTAVVTEAAFVGISTIGDQELSLVRHIADCGGATVGEVAASYGDSRGLARSTVLTMMERLRRKGFLTRRLIEGVYRYSARRTSAELTRGAIRRFVERSLDGSVTPFVAYLSETAEISDEDLRELRSAVARLESDRRKGSRS